MLCYVMLCYAMLCYAVLCYAVLCYAAGPVTSIVAGQLSWVSIILSMATVSAVDTVLALTGLRAVMRRADSRLKPIQATHSDSQGLI